MRQLAFPAALCAALLAGCGPDSKPVTSAATAGDQAAAAPGPTSVSQAAAAPCAEPPGTGDPAPSNPLNEVRPKLSEKALRSQKNGCAGVRFHLALDGSVHDATVVAEEPKGFGFGDAAVAALGQTRFGPGQPKSDWYYYDYVIVQSQAAGSSVRPSVY